MAAASSTSSLIDDVSHLCNRLSARDRYAADLSTLLANPHMEALAQVYDNVVAQKKYQPNMQHNQHRNSSHSPKSRTTTSSSGTTINTQETYELDVLNGNYDHQEPSNALRVIGMRKKDNEPLGMTVKEENGRVVVARIMAGGLVDKQGLLHVKDTIVEVNGVEIKKPEQFIEEVKRSHGGVTFKILPSFHVPNSTPPVYLRALFSYDPSVDTLLPCKELGIPFVTGEVIEVLNREDSNWWQARKLDQENSPVGLIPSQELEEMRRAFVSPEFDYSSKITICGTKVTKQKKKEMYQLRHFTDFEKAELQLYEEVCRMPPFDRKTLVLIGAQGVGRRTLKQRLIEYDPERFSSPLPHTSRPIREHEMDGKQYHFVRRDIMEEDIANNKYLECGELQGHLYGTKLDSIRSIIRSGKMCVIDCNPQCLKLLKTKEFMPFVVFIGAPSLDQLRYMHEWGRSHGLYGQTGTLNSRTYHTVSLLIDVWPENCADFRFYHMVAKSVFTIDVSVS